VPGDLLHVSDDCPRDLLEVGLQRITSLLDLTLLGFKLCVRKPAPGRCPLGLLQELARHEVTKRLWRCWRKLIGHFRQLAPRTLEQERALL